MLLLLPQLYAVTIHDTYLLPGSDVCFDLLGDTCFFATLQARSDIRKSKPVNETAEITSYVGISGLYQMFLDVMSSRERPGSPQRATYVLPLSVKLHSELV